MGMRSSGRCFAYWLAGGAPLCQATHHGNFMRPRARHLHTKFFRCPLQNGSTLATYCELLRLPVTPRSKTRHLQQLLSDIASPQVGWSWLCICLESCYGPSCLPACHWQGPCSRAAGLAGVAPLPDSSPCLGTLLPCCAVEGRADANGQRADQPGRVRQTRAAGQWCQVRRACCTAVQHAQQPLGAGPVASSKRMTCTSRLLPAAAKYSRATYTEALRLP